MRDGVIGWTRQPAGRVRRLQVAFALVLPLSTLHLAVALADPVVPPQPRYGWREVWGGADATRDVWLLYTGVTLAPWSDDIYADGLRLRASSGYGQYSYRGAVTAPTPCGAPAFDPCTYTTRRFNVDHSYIDALIGYHKRYGELTAKAFIGVAAISHRLDASDPDNAVAGDDFGVKGVVELWLNLGPRGWTSLDLNYTTAHDTAAARWRAGWRMLPTVSLGPEVRYDVNADDDAGRVGAFLRYDWFGGEISVAGGVAGTMTGGEDQDLAPYATLNVLFQY
ncbi:MAG: cellulose biosynthesis protein BcsS [Hyphomicrobium sp.]